MAADTFVVEVGEKTAMRRRLLNAWQFIRVLKGNRAYQNFYRHLMQSLIILLTFISVLTGVMSYDVSGTVNRGDALCSCCAAVVPCTPHPLALGHEIAGACLCLSHFE